MTTFESYLNGIIEPDKRIRITELLDHIKSKYPTLNEEIKWNQPMFSDHGTFILGLSMSKGHISVAPESKTMRHFEMQIQSSGYTFTQELFRIKWTDDINYDLIDSIIEYNIADKKDITTFWRA